MLRSFRAAFLGLLLAVQLVACGPATAGPGFGTGFGFNKHRPATGVAAPANTGLPRFLDGAGTTVTAPVVGQNYFAYPGSWSNTPTGFTYSVTNAHGTAGSWGSSAPLPLFQSLDIDAGGAYTLSVTASNIGGSSSASSAATSAVANINLAGAITALSRTSVSGATPMTWSVTFGPNVYEGYYLRDIVYSDGTLSSVVQSIRHRLSHADLQAGATLNLAPDGLTDPTATQYMTLGVETTSPLGLGYSYTYGTALTPTDAVVAMTWSTTDKSATTALSGGNLVATASATWSSVRSSRGIGSGKQIYFELTGDCYPAVADATADLTAAWGGGGGDGSATTHAAEYQPGNGFVFYNGSGTAAAGYTAGSTWGIALDTTASPYTAAFYKNNVLQATKSLTSIGATVFIAAQLSTSHTATLNAGTTPGGTTGFTYTPPTGFVAP